MHDFHRKSSYIYILKYITMSCFCILILTKYSPYVKNACYIVFHYSLPSHNTYIFLTEAAAASVNIVPKSWMLLLFFPIPHDEERCHHQYQHHTLIVLAEFTKQNRRRKPVPPIGNCAVVGYNFVYVPGDCIIWCKLLNSRIKVGVRWSRGESESPKRPFNCLPTVQHAGGWAFQIPCQHICSLPTMSSYFWNAYLSN